MITMKRVIKISLLASLISSAAFAEPVRPLGASDWYYRMGGGDSFLLYKQSNRHNFDYGVGADWQMFRGCEFDPRISVANTFEDLQNSIYGLAKDVVASAEGALTSWGLSKVQEAYPTLYDFVMNGAKDAQSRFQLAMKSCRDYQSDLNAKRNPIDGWIAMGKSNSWAKASEAGSDPVQVDATIDRDAGNEGIIWINGERRGGRNQDPIKVISDVTKRGYQQLADPGLSSVVSQTAPKNIGGTGDELGAGLDNDSLVFPRYEDAVSWTISVVGEREISTCDDCDRLVSKVGQGLRSKVLHERNDAVEDLINVIKKPSPTLDDLNAISVPEMGFVVTDHMMRTLKSLKPAEQAIFANKLAGEIALLRVMAQAFTARDLLNAGMQDPNVAANNQAIEELEAAKKRLDEEVKDLMFESDVRKKVFSTTAVELNSIALQRENSADLSELMSPKRALNDMKGGAVKND